MDAEVPQGRGVAQNIAIPGIKNIIAVSSGKGGVGKSTVAVNLAVSLALDGAKVGLMDADVYGPNVPLMMGVGNRQPEVTGNNKLKPIEAHGVKTYFDGDFRSGGQTDDPARSDASRRCPAVFERC